MWLLEYNKFISNFTLFIFDIFYIYYFMYGAVHSNSYKKEASHNIRASHPPKLSAWTPTKCKPEKNRHDCSWNCDLDSLKANFTSQEVVLLQLLCATLTYRPWLPRLLKSKGMKQTLYAGIGLCKRSKDCIQEGNPQAAARPYWQTEIKPARPMEENFN